MKCFSHPQTDAVAACVRCGKAMCKACASQSDDGRLVCSRACSISLSKGPQFAVGCFFLIFGGAVVVWAIRMFAIHAGEVSVIALIYALICLLVGAILVSQGTLSNRPSEPFCQIHGEIRSRAGMALRAAHRFRKKFAELLSAYDELSGEKITFSQLEWTDAETRHQILLRICEMAEPMPAWMPASIEKAASDLDELIGLAHSIGWSYFAEHDFLSKSFEERRSIILDLTSAACKLDSEFTLYTFRQNLAKRAKVEGKS